MPVAAGKRVNRETRQPRERKQPTANSQRPTANSQHPTPNIQHPTPNSQQPTANSQQPTANSQQPTPNSQQPTANIQQPTSNSQHPTSNIQQPTSNIQQPTSNSQHPTPNTQQPTPNSQQPTSNSQRPTANIPNIRHRTTNRSAGAVAHHPCHPGNPWLKAVESVRELRVEGQSSAGVPPAATVHPSISISGRYLLRARKAQCEHPTPNIRHRTTNRSAGAVAYHPCHPGNPWLKAVARQGQPARARIRSANVSPMASAAVAAGDGALITCRIPGCSSKWKSSTNRPSTVMA